MEKLSPMMQQYMEIKKNYKDSILFFRLGDFYEMFFEDATLVSKELDLTLTGRKCGNNEKAPMCGVPYHSCESYIQRLVKKGYKVAICEQDAITDTNKLVDRNIVRVVTAGTIIENNMLDEAKNNYICSVYISEDKQAAVSFCDVSTAELSATFIEQDISDRLLNEIASYNPCEIILNLQATKNTFLVDFINSKLSATVEIIDEHFSESYCLSKIKSYLKNNNKKLIEKLNNGPITFCLYMLFDYLSKTQMSGLENISQLQTYSQSKFLSLDYNSRNNLELCSTIISKEKKGSLLWVLDNTRCPMGKRMIKSWIEQPLVDINEIKLRQDAVASLKENLILCDDIREILTHIHDIERLMTKVVYGSVNARELISLRDAFELIPKIKSILSKLQKNKKLADLNNQIDDLTKLYSLLSSCLVDDPPITVKEGQIIKKGFSKELDDIINEADNASSYLIEIENKERQRTGIPKLKIAYNRVFGYYIEISNSFKDKVPSDYIRKQTLTTGERFINQELKELEVKLLTAKDRRNSLEYEIFEKIRKLVASENEKIRATIHAIATLDVLASLAVVAHKQNYCKPELTNDGKIIIKESRHPVVEKLLKSTPFVPNDVCIDTNSDRLLIITGPNMAGKSTYMRQIALISLMAQMGSFVPAKNAKISIVDKIFTRVGASDNLSSGQSTFMLEMTEVADILKKATKDSLIILDEIGRGTSTYDGMSIARAVLEYCADKQKLGAKTLFSTHYHELSALEGIVDGVKNYNICVKKHGDNITFLRRIVRGGADRSYGIEVAKLAGVPSWVIERAKDILNDIEHNLMGNYSEIYDKKTNLTDDSAKQECDFKVLEKLKTCDVETLSPIEALNILYELKNILHDE